MFTLNRISKIVVTSLFASTLLAGAGSAMAETTWAKNHPRRHEVNHRLANQNARIDRKVAAGEMTQGQAAQLHHEDHQVRQEERAMASQNGGHITRQEQRTLNAQENGISQQIHNQ